MAMAMAVSKQWTRVRTLGRGASGTEVFLAADDASGELFAVKSARASGAAALRREQGIMSGLRSTRVVSCIGGRAGSYNLFLEFAPGGSLADEVAKSGGGLDEHTVRAYAADVARGLAYLHGESMVHGDVKARNVVIGADGRAKLADFGCARKAFLTALRREQAVMSGLCSPRVVSCIGGRDGRDGSYQLFLEFAQGGSLADVVVKSGSGLDEHTVRAYAADVAAGLAYLHGESMVHADVKARNVVIGADGRAKLADFGCARKAGAPIIGGTPAFMAPEVARGEEQGPAADVWALGCTVVELATGRAPWSCADSNALAVMHRIGYTEAVPEVPQWLSAEAKDFLGMCFVRRASDRCTAAQLLEHPFLACASSCDAKQEAVKSKWVSPKSTLDAAFWESESDSEEADDELSHSSTAERIKALACPASVLPDWDSEEGWIDVLSAAPTEAPDAVAMPAEETTGLDLTMTSAEPIIGAESGVPDISVDYYSSVLCTGDADCDSVWHSRQHQSLEIVSVCSELPNCTQLFCRCTQLFCNTSNENSVGPNTLLCAACLC